MPCNCESHFQLFPYGDGRVNLAVETILERAYPDKKKNIFCPAFLSSYRSRRYVVLDLDFVVIAYSAGILVAVLAVLGCCLKLVYFLLF